jgi:hypothetical protein
MQIKARKCFVPISPSRWVAKVYLTCDNKLAVEYRRGQRVKKVLPHGPGAYLGYGGAPNVCCLYPGTQGELAENLYDLADIWSYGGEWVHAFLYKKFGYLRVSPPGSCGGCNTSCTLSLNPANPVEGQTVTITVTVTNTDGGPKGEAPQGTVTISVDGAILCTQTLPADEPDSKNYQTISCNWNASCVPTPTHTIEAVYTPAEPDFAGTSCSTSVTVSGCGCCPNGLPATLYLTVSDAGGCACLAGTYALTYNANLQEWDSNSISVCGQTGISFTLKCTNNQLYVTSGCGINTPLSGNCNPVQFSATGVNVSVCCSGSINVSVTS